MCVCVCVCVLMCRSIFNHDDHRYKQVNRVTYKNALFYNLCLQNLLSS